MTQKVGKTVAIKLKDWETKVESASAREDSGACLVHGNCGRSIKRFGRFSTSQDAKWQGVGQVEILVPRSEITPDTRQALNDVPAPSRIFQTGSNVRNAKRPNFFLGDGGSLFVAVA